MILAEPRLDIRRSNSVAIRLPGMAYNTSGWTVVASTSQIVKSFKRLLRPCSVGTSGLQNATCIYLMFLQRRENWEMRSLKTRGNKLFERVGGSLGVGHFRNSSRQHQCNSSVKGATDLATNSLSNNLSTKSRRSPFLHFEGLPCLSSALSRNSAGQRTGGQHEKKIRHILLLAFSESL